MLWKRQKKKSNFKLTKKESGTTAGRTGLSVHFPTTGPGLATAGIPGKTLTGIGGPLLTLVGVNGLKIPGRPHRKLFQLQRKRPLKDATLPKAVPVSAVTVGEPPGLSRPKARPEAKSTLSPSSAVLSAVILSNFGLGSSFATDDMMTGRVDLRLGFEPPTVMHEPQAFVPAAIAPLQVFGTGEDPFEPPQLSQSHELFCVEDLDLPGLNTTFKDTFLEEHLLVSSISNHDDWILFGSGAATHCCPKDFTSDWPLLPLTGRAPPLRSISGQPLTVFARRIVKMNFDGQDSFLHFYVCDVPYCVVSVGRLLRQGYSVQLSSEEHSLVNPEGCRIPVERHGLLLFLRPTLLPFNQPEFEQMCNLLKDPSTSGTLVAHTAPQYSHTDKWELSGNTLTRTHKRSRATFFSPDGTKDRPVGLEDLADERTTFLEYEDGSKETLVDNWREVENPKERSSQRFVGKTVFKLKSAPTGKLLLRKRSTFPEPQPLQEPETTEPQEPFKKKLSKEVSVEDTFATALCRLQQELWKSSRLLCLSSCKNKTLQRSNLTRTTFG